MASSTVVFGVVVLLVVLIVVAAITHWGVFESDAENADSGTERVQQEAENNRDDYTVSLFKRHKSLTLPSKVLLACVSLLATGGAVYAYLVLRNGAPVNVPYADAMQQGFVVILSFLAGVYVSNARERGRVDVIYEDSDGGVRETDTIYYRPGETTTDSDGTPIVYETHPRRILGLFDRRKLAVHDRQLRSQRAILHDTVGHELPSHAVEVSSDQWVLRTQGESIPPHPDEKAADYRYQPPIQLDYAEYVKNQERVSKMQTKLDSMKAQLAEAEQEVRRLSDKLETKKESMRDEFKSDVMDILRTVQMPNTNFEVKPNGRKERQPRSQREVDDLNGTGDSEGVSS